MLFDGYLPERRVSKQRAINAKNTAIVPIRSVVGEGGGCHAKGPLPKYLERLEATGRKGSGNALHEKYPQRRF